MYIQSRQIIKPKQTPAHRSALMALSVTLGSAILSPLGAYALADWPAPGTNASPPPEQLSTFTPAGNNPSSKPGKHAEVKSTYGQQMQLQFAPPAQTDTKPYEQAPDIKPVPNGPAQAGIPNKVNAQGQVVPNNSAEASANMSSNDNLETISLHKPELKALITVSQKMNPFGLDANYSQPISLREALETTVDRNLDIADSRAGSKIEQWNFLNNATKFLPDVTMNYTHFNAKGLLALGPILGTSSSGSSNEATHIDTPFTLMSAGFNQKVYQGGKVMFSTLQARHQMRAARAGLKATISDALLESTRNYYNLLLNEALLQIRIRAVATSEELMRNNSNMMANGLATNLDVLQSRTQLAKDRQNLIEQQTARRSAAIKLADTLNLNLGGDLIPNDLLVRKVRLISDEQNINHLLLLAIEHRPELKQYEELRLAAKRAIVVAGAPLQPTVAVGGSIYGIGASQVEALYTLNFSVNFAYGGLGTTDLTNIQKSRWQARQSLIQANKVFVDVISQVRNALLQALSSERRIDETTDEVDSAQEELRLAKIRFENGIGTNLDVITAQRDLTTAYIDKAQAIVNYNIAEAQLLHDVGMISVDSLSSGRMLTE